MNGELGPLMAAALVATAVLVAPARTPRGDETDGEGVSDRGPGRGAGSSGGRDGVASPVVPRAVTSRMAKRSATQVRVRAGVMPMVRGQARTAGRRERRA